MPLRCIFHTPAGPHFCQVLEARGTPELKGKTRQLVQQRTCTCGAFISCPIFQRVEVGLVQIHRERLAVA